jgi:5-hydroxyisourate hydrolase
MTPPSDAPDAAKRLTTHVLDLTCGQPARGIGLVLSRVGDDGPVALLETRTNEDGRTVGALLAGDELAPGRYELAFAVGAYFAGTGRPDELAYLDIVPIRFGVGADVGHLHVALLITPWSYTTYRGS